MRVSKKVEDSLERLKDEVTTNGVRLKHANIYRWNHTSNFYTIENYDEEIWLCRELRDNTTPRWYLYGIHLEGALHELTEKGLKGHPALKELSIHAKKVLHSLLRG